MLSNWSSLNSKNHSDAYWDILGNTSVYKKLEQKNRLKHLKHKESFELQPTSTCCGTRPFQLSGSFDFVVPSSDLRDDFALTMTFSHVCSDRECSLISTLCTPAQTFPSGFINFHSLTLTLAGTESSWRGGKQFLWANMFIIFVKRDFWNAKESATKTNFIFHWTKSTDCLEKYIPVTDIIQVNRKG